MQHTTCIETSSNWDTSEKYIEETRRHEATFVSTRQKKRRASFQKKKYLHNMHNNSKKINSV